MPFSALSDEEKRKLLAAQVEAIRDVITDENGEVVALPDDDPKTDEQEIIAPDDNPLGTLADQPNLQANVQGGDNPARPGDELVGANGAVPPQRKPVDGNKGLVLDRGYDPHVARKDYPATKDAFTADVATNLSDAASGSITPAAFASIRPVQWVVSPGAGPSASATTRCTVAAGSGGLPGLRVLSRTSPSTPSSM